MKIGSGGKTNATVNKPIDVTEPIVSASEKILTVEIPKPVIKDVVIEVPKPTYKIVEVEEVVKKPKIRVDEVTQSVIKPVFTIKQETIVLDQLQKKLDESVELALAKLSKLNSATIEKNIETEALTHQLKTLSKELVRVKVATGLIGLTLAVSAVVSLLG